MVNKAAAEKAMKMTTSAFKLWVYLDLNQNGHEFGLSRADVMKVCSISAGTYENAVKELVAKGFLIPVYFGEREGFIFKEDGK